MDVNKILADLRLERARIDAVIEALSNFGTGAHALSSVQYTAPHKRKRMSAAARKGIKAAQKKRWVKQKAAK